MNLNVINLTHRLDRWLHIRKTFEGHPIVRFNALTHPQGGWVGCMKSHAALLEQLMKDDDSGMYTVLEDDCDLIGSREDFDSRWPKYQEYLARHQGEWDFFSGGGVYVIPNRIVCRDPFIVECDWSVCTQFVVYTKRSAKTMIDYAAQTEWDTACDNNLARNHKGKIWLPYPMFCKQLENNKSDIASTDQQETLWSEFRKAQIVLDSFVKQHAVETYSGLANASDVTAPHLGGNIVEGDPLTYAPSVWDYLTNRFSLTSVLDLGSGRGYSSRYFHDRGLRVLAVDGMKDNCLNAVYPTVQIDLTKAMVVTNVDLVHCQEVVEHIEERYAHNLLSSLACGKFIVMTNALPGQGGHHHVNEQPTQYWVDLLSGYGYDVLVEDTNRVRKLATNDGATYLANTGLVLAKRKL
jgi:hypothetical protein